MTCKQDGCALAVRAKGFCNRHYLADRRRHTKPSRKPTPVCTAPGCDRATVARGLCMKHYHRARNRGALDEYAKVTEAWHVACGVCGTHLGQLPHRDADPWAVFGAHRCRRAA